MCVEMEGAGIAQAAYLNKVSYVIIRAISDKADNSATMDYPTFEKKAITHSVRLMKELLPMILDNGMTCAVQNVTGYARK